MYLPSNTFELSIAMLLFWGVTEKFPLQPHHQRMDLVFFATKKQPTYRGQWSSSRRRSKQKKNTPTLLRGQSSNFGFFLLVFSWWPFCGVSFLPCFCLTHFFGCPFNPFDWFTAFELVWMESIGEKKHPFLAVVLAVHGRRFWPTGSHFPFQYKGLPKNPFLFKKLPKLGAQKTV